MLPESMPDRRLPPLSRWDRTLLGYYAAYGGNSLPTFGDNIGPIFKGQETQDVTDRLSRNVGKKLPTQAA
jgi:hypothetical protein